MDDEILKMIKEGKPLPSVEEASEKEQTQMNIDKGEIVKQKPKVQTLWDDFYDDYVGIDCANLVTNYSQM